MNSASTASYDTQAIIAVNLRTMTQHKPLRSVPCKSQLHTISHRIIDNHLFDEVGWSVYLLRSAHYRGKPGLGIHNAAFETPLVLLVFHDGAFVEVSQHVYIARVNR